MFVRTFKKETALQDVACRTTDWYVHSVDRKAAEKTFLIHTVLQRCVIVYVDRMAARTAVTVADVLRLRDAGLSASETWSLLCQATQGLQDLFLSREFAGLPRYCAL